MLFTADGDYSMFVDDLVEAGADGFVFEPMIPLAPMATRLGRTHVLVGSCVDCRTLTHGSADDILREMDATFELAADCPGFVFAVGNHLPVNIPIERLELYFDHPQANWWR